MAGPTFNQMEVRSEKARIRAPFRCSGAGSGRGADVRAPDLIRRVGFAKSVSQSQWAPEERHVVQVRGMRAHFRAKFPSSGWQWTPHVIDILQRYSDLPPAPHPKDTQHKPKAGLLVGPAGAEVGRQGPGGAG